MAKKSKHSEESKSEIKSEIDNLFSKKKKVISKARESDNKEIPKPTKVA
jgi:hypothetical protein